MATLGTIRGNVRRNLGEATARFYTNADLNQFIGEAYKHYSLIMIEQGEGYFETTTNLGFTANNPLVSLSALNPVFFSVSELRRNTSSGKLPMHESQDRYIANLTVGVTAGESYIPDYKLRGMNIVLLPTPSTTEAASSTTGLSLDYNYVPIFPDASSADGFTFNSDFSTAYEPIIELYATIAALEAKDGMGGVSDINSFRDRLQKFEMSFMDSLARVEEPDRVVYSGMYYGNPYYY